MPLTHALLTITMLATTAEEPAPLMPTGEAAGFTFYAVPGISQHHFLHQWARRLMFDGEIEPRRLPDIGLDPQEGASVLGREEQGPWMDAVGAYQRIFANERLVFSTRNHALLDAIRAGALSASEDVGGEDVERLRRVRATYLNHWWPAHRAAIVAYQEQVTPVLEKYSQCMVAGLERAYGAWIPDGEPVRVDLAFVTNWAGAYTTGDPVVLHVAVSDPELQGTLALEMMYHEASHSHWVQPRIQRLVAEAFATENAEAPQRLWHTVLFHTAGTLARNCLAPEVAHTRYAEVVGLARFANWQQPWAALDAHWAPYLAGDSDDRAAAMAAVARALGPADAR